MLQLGLVGSATALSPEGKAEAAALAPTEVHRTQHFDIEHTMSDAWAAEVGEHLERLAVQFYEQMSELGAPSEPERLGGERLRWRFLIGTPASGPARLSSTYDSRHHAVVFRLTPRAEASPLPDAPYPSDSESLDRRRSALLTRISHEIAHQLAFDCGLQKRGVMYPIWVAEGLATNFESPDDSVVFLGPNPSRQDRLARLAGDGTLLSLPRLVVASHVRGLSPEERSDVYAQAWGLFRYLALHRTAELEAHLRMLASLPVGRRSKGTLFDEMTRSFGSLEALEAEWRSWIASDTVEPPIRAAGEESQARQQSDRAL